MLKLSELVGQELKWVQPHAMKMEHELRAGDKIAGTLSFPNFFDSFASAASADGTWTFERIGFWRTKVIIRASGTESDLAVFKPNTWNAGGILELPDGRAYLAHTNFWATQYEFRTQGGEALVGYRNIGGILHMSALIEIYPFAKEIAELPWIVLLGWYLTVMMCVDSASATVI